MADRLPSSPAADSCHLRPSKRPIPVSSRFDLFLHKRHIAPSLVHIDPLSHLHPVLLSLFCLQSRGAPIVLPLTVKQISEAYHSNDDKSNFVIDGADASNVNFSDSPSAETLIRSWAWWFGWCRSIGVGSGEATGNCNEQGREGHWRLIFPWWWYGKNWCQSMVSFVECLISLVSESWFDVITFEKYHLAGSMRLQTRMKWP